MWESPAVLDPDTAQPCQFHAVPPVEHLLAYRAGIGRAAQHDPWTGLLVSMHGAGLYNGRYGSWRLEEIVGQRFTDDEQALVDEFLRDMASLQRDLAHQSFGHARAVQPADEPFVREAYLLLQVWDRLSLQFAFRHAVDGSIAPAADARRHPNAGVPQRRALSGCASTRTRSSRTSWTSRCRPSWSTTARYTDPEDWLAALAAAPRWALECRVTRMRLASPFVPWAT